MKNNRAPPFHKINVGRYETLILKGIDKNGKR